MRGVPATAWLKSALPVKINTLGVQVRNRIQAARYRGDAVFCPLCGRSYSRFVPRYGREFAACPGCYSLERHRMFWLFFERQTNLLSEHLRVLHIAPEDQLERRLRALPNLDYVTADLLRKDVDVQLDVTKMQLPDESFDVVLCSHVLEHVPDDGLAMRELRRVTRPSGWALLTAPVDPERDDTFEDWSVTTPAGRTEVFGQWDHVRIYGRNFTDLLRGEGWSVDETPMPLSTGESQRFGIPGPEQRIYLSRPAV